MAIPVKDLKGSDDEIVSKLAGKGIKNSDQLLEAAAEAKRRKALAKELEMDQRVLLELANRADLSRVKGVAGVYSDLLEQAGVDTVKELATRRPDNLHAKIVAVNEERKLSGKVPRPEDVESWVAQAKDLPKLLTY